MELQNVRLAARRLANINKHANMIQRNAEAVQGHAGEVKASISEALDAVEDYLASAQIDSE
eukprot:CAMPEP_0184733394 /NCGR_PEP_ID=MMETSP0314-20130426/57266_1 /TAXON_ID=38298 /ORGANISM="Rhodella maculata, Strain CCMP 736" /LENGTH=60 /DNA_ID=CAMNT_0027200195 /DNA_START=1 /DNA_END=183 /DNA_ORIENTATION=+